MHLVRECIFQVLITQKVLTFVISKYDIRIQLVKLCLKNLTLFIFSLSKAVYVLEIYSAYYGRLLPKFTLLCVSIMHFRFTRTLQLTKIEKRCSTSIIFVCLKY